MKVSHSLSPTERMRGSCEIVITQLIFEAKGRKT